MSMSVSDHDILLVEDSPGDVMLVREAFAGLEQPGALHVVNDGGSALDFLRRDGDFASVPVPDLIMLDLNLPVLDGREVLREIKNHPDWRRIPVAVLSTSDNEDDIRASYDLQANCYIVKPMDLASFRRAMGALNEFWLSVVKFPPKH
ncbi:MAG: response regulator [Alphaproteobacteria bacterium]